MEYTGIIQKGKGDPMRRWMAAFCCAALAMAMLIPCRAQAVELSATAAILVDAGSGEVLFEKNANKKMLIASTTKIMTALVALEWAHLGECVEISDEHMVEGSSMYLRPGEKVTVEELLYGLLLCSGNDAALALADHCGGTVRFVERMNAKAHALGMESTSFENPNGLDGKTHYSTAADMARLACAAANHPTFVRICSTTFARVGERTMKNHNRLLQSLEGCIGMKTGYTRAAGRTLVSCVEREGHRLVAVTLQDGNDWLDHAALYDYGFERISGVRTAG